MVKQILLALLAIVTISPISLHAQSRGDSWVLPGAERKFVGHWVCESEPTQIIDIYKDGSLVIIHTHGAKHEQDIVGVKYVASEIVDNKLIYFFGKDSEQLVVNDDGSRIYFKGRQFDKK